MLLALYLFLPVATCYLWVLIHCLIASKTETFRVFTTLFTACGTYIFAEACHAIANHGSTLYTVSTLIEMLAGPSIVPLLIRYLQRLMHHKRSNNPYFMLWIVIPVTLFFAGTLLYVIGFDFTPGDRVHRMFHTITEDVFNGILAVELLYLLVYVAITLQQRRMIPGTVFGFLFKKKRIGLSRLQLAIGMVPMIVMTARVAFRFNLYGNGTPIAMISATLLFLAAFFFGLNALFGNQPIISARDYRTLTRFNYNLSNKEETLERMMNDLKGDSGSLPEPQQNTEENELAARFDILMTEKKLFLSPRLTLEDVASSLNSNKTYVSRMVNDVYKTNFPEVINKMRVEYAEQYILSHRDANQIEIAKNCGFLSASSFNIAFKRVTGTTPKLWLAGAESK